MSNGTPPRTLLDALLPLGERRAMAREIGCSPATIVRICKGSRPIDEYAQALTEALARRGVFVSPDVLVAEQRNPSSPLRSLAVKSRVAALRQLADTLEDMIAQAS